METENVTVAAPSPASRPAAVCPQCHQPVTPEYYIWQRSHKGESASLWLSEPNASNIEDVFYFCPNCGKSLREPPLSVSAGTQAEIYILSIIMPLTAFVVIKYWPGMKYIRSADPRAKQIGLIATMLMVASTVIVVWYGIIWTEQLISSMTGGLMGAGNLGI